MKAIVSTKQGSPEVLQLQDVEKPKLGDREILVKVHAATVTRGDVLFRKMHPLMFLPLQLMGMRRKRTPGHEFAGEVVETGKDVTKYTAGDKVFGTTTGLSVGANAEFICLPESWKMSVITKMPINAAYDEAAALPVGGMTALEILNRANIRPEQKVLIYGASGSVGSYAVQLAKHYFKADVTAICSSNNIQLVKTLGADKVIDYTTEDFLQSDQSYDVIFDAVGKLSASDAKKALNEGGVFLTVKTTTKESEENLIALAILLDSGQLKVVIDSRYPLAQAADAHRKVETGHKVGNVIITVIPEKVEEK
ncbi:MAG: NAD(P)-dependent alcohol dehydrogenase [Anaerolineaceae bacterium]|nr:NAD(P)-dependent alcohol dehydrogenase [Anaerolineaceae bacterium]